MKKEGLSAETLVQTPHGNKMLKDIKVGDLVLTLNSLTRVIEIKPILEVKEFEDREAIIEVRLYKRDGKEQIIRTTKNIKMAKKHRNVKKEFEWICATDWEKGRSVLSNYICVDRYGYFMCSVCSEISGSRQKLHIICARYYLGPNPGNYIVHHIDGNKLNNRPENLIYLLVDEHARAHPRNGEKTWFGKGEKHPCFGKPMAEELKKKLRNSKIIDTVIQTDLNFNILKIYECINDTKNDGFKRKYVSEACHGKHYKKYGGHFYRDSLWFFENEYKNMIEEREANHKYIGFNECCYEGKIYHLVVEDNHNFFVGGDDGILVADYTV